MFDASRLWCDEGIKPSGSGVAMIVSRRGASLLFALAATGCGSGHSVDPPNAAIAAQVNEAASNISVLDGREEASPPATPQEAGAAMRAAAADRPRQP
jgi:hypothetical protein